MSRRPQTLRDMGENRLLHELLPRLPQGPGTVVGPGDDCAVVRPCGAKEDWLLTTDPVIEGRHFLADTPARLVGRKAVARAISDIAAMGGTPRWVLVNVVAPGGTPLTRVRGVFAGLMAAAKDFGCGIVGGDTAEGPALEIHVTAVGCLPRGLAVRRSGARAGHWVYVTGALGGAYRNGNRHHLLFEPRLAEGQFLAAHKWATSMMDISDGLAADLPRLLDASGRGVRLEVAAIPLSPAARRTAHPWRHALDDGEDFELLFTVAARQRTLFERAWAKAFPILPATCIGTILADPKQREIVFADGTRAPLLPGGYEHFLPNRSP